MHTSSLDSRAVGVVGRPFRSTRCERFTALISYERAMPRQLFQFHRADVAASR
jgi:hypothetical protein